MPRVKVSDEEMAELEGVQRHDEIKSLVRMYEDREFERLRTLISNQNERLTRLIHEKNLIVDISRFAQELEPVLTELQELKAILSKPKSFKVERGDSGLIERIVVE